MRRKLIRTVFSVLIVVGAVLAVRWTIRAAMTHAYRAKRDVGAVEMPAVPAPRVWSLAKMVPAELHVNLAGLAIRRRAERLHMPYNQRSKRKPFLRSVPQMTRNENRSESHG